MTNFIQRKWRSCTCLATVLILSLGLSGGALAGGWGGWGGDGWGGGGGGDPKADFVIPMNYELGMHCTGFEFAYCCVLPPYNSILAQVIKTQDGNDSFPVLLEGDPNIGKDAVLKRETVVRDPELDGSGNFKKYVIKYRHEAQPRNDGRGKAQTSTLISAAEGNSLFMWNTIYDRTTKNADGTLTTGTYNNATDVPVGDGIIDGVNDNYASGWLNHLYIYVADGHPNLEGKGATGVDTDKIYLGIDVPIATDCGPALHPLGPVTTDPSDPNNTVPNDCGGAANGNLLTFSTDDGTIVYTKMKVLDDLPVMLTSPRIWEALGLPLTPFEDTIGFFSEDPLSGPGSVDEDSIRPYVKMIADLHDYQTGQPVLDSSGNPVTAFGTAPIDIPNCERCHSELQDSSFNSAQQENGRNAEVAALVQMEMDFWEAYYNINPASDSTWYSRLKGAAISILAIHDNEHGTEFMTGGDGPGGFFPDYPAATCTDLNDCQATFVIEPNNPGLANPLPQNTRLGHESVICQKCHADNVIAVVRGASCGPDSISCETGDLIPPVTEAIHDNHRNVSEGGDISFTDSLGRDGGCQGCHPAHRSDGVMDGYPITIEGDNREQDGDNRLAAGGCFVGRDVHSNRFKDQDGAETPEYLNAVGEWLSVNVFNGQSNEPGGNEDVRGIWCTNCHSQLGQEIWKAENVYNLIEGTGVCVDSNGVNDGQQCKSNGDCGSGEACALNNVRALPSLAAIASAIGVPESTAISWLDPKGKICEGTGDPELDGRNCNVDVDCGSGFCVDKSNDGVDRTHAIWDPVNEDANVATIEVAAAAGNCLAPYDTAVFNDEFDVFVCVKLDGEGDPNVNILDFCTTDDCVDAANFKLASDNRPSIAAPVPFRAATDGRDHWLAPGEPHCADCHEAPYVEQSGNINPFPPFNYPRKAALMRYSRGHRDITCQGCHESIHGLYPVTPPSFSGTGVAIDQTSWDQAAQWNADGSHGPLKCQTCHEANSDGVWEKADDLTYKGRRIRNDFDAAVGWMHTFTAEADPREDFCQNCHGDEADEICRSGSGGWSKGGWGGGGSGSCDWEEEWLEHAMKGRASRNAMDQTEILQVGYVAGDPDFENPLNTVCQGCHGNESGDVQCDGSDGREWKRHLTEGRVSESVWEHVSIVLAGSTCGW